jgi:Terminase large subunit, T4likevirus-type, N-terminal
VTARPFARLKTPEGARGLLSACDDRNLFGFPLWKEQRKLLAAVEQGPRLHVWALGRRSGKTTMAALVGLWDCLLRPELGALVRPGERRYSVAVATNKSQARLFVSAARSIVERSPLLAKLVESVEDDELAFSNGTALTAFPCTSRGVRGWPISSLLFDEAAHMLDSDGNAAAEPLWRALLPSTSQFGDQARIILSSTPYGQDGLFAEMHQRAASGELGDAQAQHATTEQVNPTIGQSFLEQERARDPDGFASEYLAEFLAGGLAFIERERLLEVVDEDRRELPPDEVRACVLGLDPSFAHDPAGVAVVGRDRLDHQLLVLAHAERFVPSKRRRWKSKREIEDQQELVLDAVARLAKRYGAKVVTDQHLPGVVVDGLAERGVRATLRPWRSANKTEAFKAVRARVYARRLELYPEPQLLAELQRLRVNYRPGAAEVVNPRAGGSHGDMADALALAVQEFETYGGGSDPDYMRRHANLMVNRGPESRALAGNVLETRF